MNFFRTECRFPFRIGSSNVVSIVRFYRYFIRKLFFLFPYQGTNVMNLMWKNLIILDACRFDVFQEVNDIKGKLYKIRSVGSSTPEWQNRTFKKKYHDIIYISANPYISEYIFKKTLGFNPFLQIIPVWDWGWNNDFLTVHPKVMNETYFGVKESLLETQKIRIILHYMQPHHPFIGKMKIKTIRTWDELRKRARGIKINKRGHTIWDLLREGKISIDVAKEAYKQNLSFVLNYIKNLLPHLSGTTIITSDHGNLFGEYKLFAHPKGIYFKELIEVPLLVVDRKQEVSR